MDWTLEHDAHHRDGWLAGYVARRSRNLNVAVHSNKQLWGRMVMVVVLNSAYTGPLPRYL